MLSFIEKYLKRLLEREGLHGYDLDKKVLHVEDIYGHRSDRYRYIDFKRYYELIKEGINSLEVLRKPYLGIYSDDAYLGESLHRMLKELGVTNVFLGNIMHIEDIDKTLKLVDYLYIISEVAPRIEKSIGLNEFIFSDRRLGLYLHNKYSIIYSSPDILDVLASSLYLVRPLQTLLYGYPYRLNKIVIPDISPNFRNGIYPVNVTNDADYSISDVEDFNGLMVKYDNVFFIEMIS